MHAPTTNPYTAFEQAKWNKYFEEALSGKGQEHMPSRWWQISDDDSIHIIKKWVSKQSMDVAEPGCGSAGSSFYLSRFVQLSSLTLCDISPNALSFARTLEPASLQNKVQYHQADLLQLPFADESFDLTWNVGVVEHYPLPQIYTMIGEMYRVTKRGGCMMVAIPNRNSVAVLKAWLLGTAFGRKFLRWIPGYRFDTERLWGNTRFQRLLAARLQQPVVVEYAGNLLWVGAPDWLVKITDTLFTRSPFSFLSFFVCKK